MKVPAASVPSLPAARAAVREEGAGASALPAPSPAALPRPLRAALRLPAQAGRACSPQQLQAVAVGARGISPASRGHAPPGPRGPREPPRARPQAPGRPAAAKAGDAEQPRAAGRAEDGGGHDTDARALRPRPPRAVRPPLLRRGTAAAGARRGARGRCGPLVPGRRCR